MTAAYWPEDGQTFEPLVLPTRCVYSNGTGPDCRITFHHLRERKTGPGFPIVVLECKEHRRSFTLYPLGHVPYGRVAIAPVCVNGKPLRCADNGDAEAKDNPRPQLRRDVWSATVFRAAVDAASGEAWPREAQNGMCWETQRRYLAEAARILGISPAPSSRIGEAIAVALDVPRLTLIEAERDDASGGGGFQSRGDAIVDVLSCIQAGRCVLDRVLAASVLAGRWIEIHRWERASHGPHCKVFRGRGIPDG